MAQFSMGIMRLTGSVLRGNQHNVDRLKKKYTDYEGIDHIKICYDAEIDAGDLVIGDKAFNYNTLEPKLLKANSLNLFNTLFGTDHTLDNLHKYMLGKKTECALTIFSSDTKITYPQYILDAIAK
jgi:putative ATP-dependent endonuclease of the OLD family